MQSRREFLATTAALVAAPRVLRAEEAAGELRIGIVGSENSHAQAYAALCNTGDGAGRRIAGARVTHLWGETPERTRQVAAAANIENIVASPDEMLGHIDAVICVRRHGGYHLQDARPFIESGLPTFVDKPLTCSIPDAEALVGLAKKHEVPFVSCSALRYAVPTVQFIDRLDETAGEITAGVVSGPCDPASEYGGIYFYGIHTVELMNAAFGFGARVLDVTRSAEVISVDCGYEAGSLVTLQLIKEGRGFHVSAEGSKARVHHVVDGGSSYYDCLQVVLDCFRTGRWPLTEEQLLEPVRLLSEIEQQLA